LSDISASLNYQLVHKFSGVRFFEPLSETFQALIDKIVLEFDAEVVDIEDIEPLPCLTEEEHLPYFVVDENTIELYPEEYQNE
jgi:hypothetical protein